ncbi:hypothetical protein [Clostridium sp.]|uniref:hypothetical protein n=1 Tax=Clostridium sp. TaxID=1506 RepID=UPI003993AB80
MEDKVRISKFEKIITALKAGEKFDLIDIVNKDKSDEKLRNTILSALETGDIRNLDYEFNGGNINLAYKSVEELVYSLELKREYPIINLYKATGSLNPIIVYRKGQTLSCDLENKKLIFNNNGEIIEFSIGNNNYSTAILVATEISRFKLSPDPSIIVEILDKIK